MLIDVVVKFVLVLFGLDQFFEGGFEIYFGDWFVEQVDILLVLDNQFIQFVEDVDFLGYVCNDYLQFDELVLGVLGLIF